MAAAVALAISERETRFELATSTLARLHSTTELLPQWEVFLEGNEVNVNKPFANTIYKWYFNKMEVHQQIIKIDRAGRVVIPKEVRKILHLVEGTSLKLEVSPHAVTLVPQEEPPKLKRKNGFLVCTGELLSDEDPVQRARDERTRELLARLGL